MPPKPQLMVLSDSQELTQYAVTPPINDPLIMLLVGGAITAICGLFFARLMQIKILSWEREQISPVPLGNSKTILSWIGSFIGLTLLCTGALQILDFSPEKSLIASLLISLLLGITMWMVTKQLMEEVANGTVKEIDDYF